MKPANDHLCPISWAYHLLRVSVQTLKWGCVCKPNLFLLKFVYANLAFRDYILPSWFHFMLQACSREAGAYLIFWAQHNLEQHD